MKPSHYFIHIWLTFVCISTQIAVAASLGIEPREIVLSDGQRFADATLFNLGEQPLMVRLELVDLAMTERGGVIELGQTASERSIPPGIDHPFAASLLRVAPRQVEIPPNGTHKIRILARGGRRPADGAYHTHLFMKIIPPLEEFTALADAAHPPSVTSEKPTGTGTTDEHAEVSMGILPIISIAHPVWLVRGDALEAQAQISNPVLDTDHAQGPAFRIRFDRTGTGRLKGDLALFARLEGHSEEVKIGEKRSVNINPEIRHLVTSLKLDEDAMEKANLDAPRLRSEDVSLRVQFTTTLPSGTANPVQSVIFTAFDL